MHTTHTTTYLPPLAVTALITTPRLEKKPCAASVSGMTDFRGDNLQAQVTSRCRIGGII